MGDDPAVVCGDLGVFMLPMSVTALTALVASTEHGRARGTTCAHCPCRAGICMRPRLSACWAWSRR